MASKTPGIILYPEDIERIKRSVKPEYQFAVIYALSQYALTGEMPTEEELGEGGMVAFMFIFDKVNDALQSFRKGQQQRQEAIRKRWNKDDTDEYEDIREDTDEYDRIRNDTTVYDSIRKPYKQKQKLKTETETINNKTGVVVENTTAATDGKVIAFDGSDLTQASEENEQAQRLVAKYMPVSRTPIELDPRVGDISELISQHGLEKVEQAMKSAVGADNRGGISVKFVESIIENKGGSKARAAPTEEKHGYNPLLGADGRPKWL